MTDRMDCPLDAVEQYVAAGAVALRRVAEYFGRYDRSADTEAETGRADEPRVVDARAGARVGAVGCVAGRIGHTVVNDHSATEEHWNVDVAFCVGDEVDQVVLLRLASRRWSA